jgi:hypothetical protein
MGILTLKYIAEPIEPEVGTGELTTSNRIVDQCSARVTVTASPIGTMWVSITHEGLYASLDVEEAISANKDYLLLIDVYSPPAHGDLTTLITISLKESQFGNVIATKNLFRIHNGVRC